MNRTVTINDNMAKKLTRDEVSSLHLTCNATINAAYADYKAVLAGGATDDDQAEAWDTAIEKRNAAYARLNAALILGRHATTALIP